MLFLYFVAFISGILTVFSPCVLPILPIVLGSGIGGKKSRVAGLILGLLISFSAAALLLSTIVTALGIPEVAIRQLAVIVLFLLGIFLIFPIWDKIQFKIENLFNINLQGKTENTFWSGFVTGLMLGIIWTPCVGPIVSTVATLAALSKFSVATAVLVFSYALGLGLPLWFIALKGTTFLSKMSYFKKNLGNVRKIFGIIVIATAIFVATGSEKNLQTWLLENLPENWTQIAFVFEEKLSVNETLSGMRNKKQDSQDFNKVDPNDLITGCLGGKDCIPSIDEPLFEAAEEAEDWLRDTDVVFGVNHNDIQKAYPQRIMNWHEIVNDTFGEDPIIVTFCPLCGTAISFISKVNGETVEFGVSGKLYNSDLVMYDRKEESYWQQATGEAIIGPAAKRNESLEWVSTTTTTWDKWKEKYPNTLVLSRNTGFLRDYELYPYGSYEENESVLFPTQNTDNRLHPKEIVYGIQVGEVTKAYQESLIKEEKLAEDQVNERTIMIEYLDSGEVSFEDKETGQKYIPLRGFWFAWVAFHPSTFLYGSN